MQIRIVAVGKIKEKFYRDAIDEYAKRLSRYCKLTIVEVEDEKTAENSSDREIERILRKEADGIEPYLEDNSEIIVLALEGRKFDSVAFSKKLHDIGLKGTSRIIFVIGGSLGLHDDIKKRASLLLSFSDMTFPHQLMRVILTEQIYRAYRIMNNEPYHK